MVKKISTLILAVLSCWSILYGQNVVDTSDVKVFRLDPENAIGSSVSKIFEEVNFIPLETTKESLFGTIDQMEILGGNLVIFDMNTKSVLIFSITGKFITKINARILKRYSESSEELDFRGFRITNDDNQNSLNIETPKSIFYFNSSGQFIKKKSKRNIKYRLDYKFNDGTEVTLGDSKLTNGDTLGYSIRLIRDQIPIKSFFPFSATKFKLDSYSRMGESLIDNKIKNELYFTNSFEYNLYRLTSENLSLIYQFIFPANYSLPLDFKSNIKYQGKRIEYFNENPNKFLAISNTYEIGGNLFFKMINWGWDKQTKRAFIYNFKSEELISVADIEPDQLSFKLPISDSGYGLQFIRTGFLTYDGNYLYTSYSSLDMLAFMDLNKMKKVKYSSALENFFKEQNKNSNPVIIQLKPKINK